MYIVIYITISYAVATPCHSQIPLLELPLLDGSGDDTYYDLVTDARISASSYLPPHRPHEARMSGNGWCANTVDMCAAESENQYLQVDFGAEVIVGAISIGSVSAGTLYVTRYFVEYGSNMNEFHHADADYVSFDGECIVPQI